MRRLPLPLLALLAAFSLIAWLGACKGSRTARPSGILLVTLDTTRADRIGAHGADGARTDAFDRVAAEGLLAERAWTPAPLTGPAHASILSGRYPPGHGLRNNGRNRLSDSIDVLPEILGRAGWRTGAFIAAFPLVRLFGFSQGFEVFDDDLGTGAGGQILSERRGDRVNARAIPWLVESLARRREQPFFGWVHYYDAHEPYRPPGQFALDFAGREYEGEIAFADSQLAQLLKVIDDAGATDEVIVLVVGDHGEGLGDFGEQEHGILLYEPMIHVPFALRAPGRVAPGTRLVEPVSLVDVLPTLLALVGVPAPEGLDGIDVLAPPAAAASEPRLVVAEALYGHEEFGWSPLHAVRRGDDKLIAAPVPERYDLAADPREQRNVVSGSDDDKLLARELQSILADSESRGIGAAPQATLDEAALEQLQSLGYVGAGSAAGGTSLEVGGRNPRDEMETHRRYLAASDLVLRGPEGCQAAMPILAELVEKDPGNPEYRMRLGQAQSCAGDKVAAEATWRALIEKFPGAILAWRRLGALLTSEGRHAEARDMWLALRIVQPGLAGLEEKLAAAYLAAGQPQEALAACEERIARHGGDAEILGVKGEVLEALGRNEEALEAHRQALAIRPTPRPMVRAARLLQSLGRPEEARQLVQSVIQRSPGDEGLQRAASQLELD